MKCKRIYKSELKIKKKIRRPLLPIYIFFYWMIIVKDDESQNGKTPYRLILNSLPTCSHIHYFEMKNPGEVEIDPFL